MTRKITLAAARIAQGYQEKLYLGNLNALRDWGYAKDYVECMWLILQQQEPDDFVIATGEYHTVREFATRAFKEVGIELEWKGEGVEEKGYDKNTGKVIVEVDPKYFRPAEVEQLLGNPEKAKKKLGWNPDDDGLLVEMPEVEVNENDPNIIKVIGVGGGGGNAVANMYKSNIEGVRFLVCNSDSKALHDSPISHRVQLGPGLGAGGKPEFGRKLAEENIEAIRGMFDDQTKMVFISAGMGGGTGTGAAPSAANRCSPAPLAPR